MSDTLPPGMIGIVEVMGIDPVIVDGETALALARILSNGARWLQFEDLAGRAWTISAEDVISLERSTPDERETAREQMNAFRAEADNGRVPGL